MRVSADIILNRQQQILERLQQQQKLSIDEIAEMFGITPSSVRRQLQDMEEKGLVTRTYKGVMLAPDWEFEEDVRSRRYAQTLENGRLQKSAGVHRGKGYHPFGQRHDDAGGCKAAEKPRKPDYHHNLRPRSGRAL